MKGCDIMEIVKNNIFAYNACVRNILADKNYLSYLLKKFVKEFKDIDRTTIESLTKIPRILPLL